jgi:DNA-directed RNA polymerase
VSQQYIQADGHYVETLYNGEKHRLASYYDCNELDVEKSKRAIMPNLIHSHDAAIAHKVVMQAGLDSIGTIHDCYITHAADAEQLNKTIRHVVHDTYADKDWLQDLGSQVGVDIPAVLERGDVSGVLDSEYMFS